MSSRRTLILMAAVVVGALAAFAIYSYVGSLEDEANENAARVEVVRIVTTVQRGTLGSEAVATSSFEPVTITEDFITGNEIDAAELAGGLIDDKIAVADLVPGQILVEGMFADPLQSRITGANRVPDDNVAITIQVDQVRGVAGLIVAGDYINMMTIPESICEGDGEAIEGGEELVDSGGTFPRYGVVDPPRGVPGEEFVSGICTPASMVFQEVQVLFVDRSPAPLAGELSASQVNADGTVTDATATANTGLLTLAVPVEAAQLIASLGSGSWYLTLLPPSYVPTPVPDFDPIIELWPGEDPALLTPYGPEGFEATQDS